MQHRIIVMDYRMKTPRKKQTRKLKTAQMVEIEEAMAEYKA